MNKKYFGIFAFPGVTGRLHLGHLRGQTVLSTHMELKSIDTEVYFPSGVHPSGNGAYMYRNKILRGQEILPDYDPSEGVISLVDTLQREYKKTWRGAGLKLSDIFISTIEPGYKNMCTAMYNILLRKGNIITDTYVSYYCDNCGSIFVDPSETDIQKGGGAKRIIVTVEYTPSGWGLRIPGDLNKFLQRTEYSLPETGFPGEIIKFESIDIEVICRCGEIVYLKEMQDQKFLTFTDEQKDSVLTYVRDKLIIYPERGRNQIIRTIKNFTQRPALRTGNWLGTQIGGAIIEPILDSTLCHFYYAVKYHYREGIINLTIEDFEKILLGEKDSTLLKEILPLDINLAGKEHLEVYFPISLLVAQAINPEILLPVCLISNNYLLSPKGGKLSKKEIEGGNISLELLREAKYHFTTKKSIFEDMPLNENFGKECEKRKNKIYHWLKNVKFIPGGQSVKEVLRSAEEEFRIWQYRKGYEIIFDSLKKNWISGFEESEKPEFDRLRRICGILLNPLDVY